MNHNNIQNPETPGISVIIPAYNYARYLPFAIDSVLQQDYPLFELIVVDDGSTDNTREIADSYGNRLRYVHQANAGLSAARNTGIKNARYPLISLLDADDVWRPGILARLAQTLSGLPDDFGMVACLQLNIDENGDLLPVRHSRRLEQTSKEVKLSDMLLKTRFGPSCVLVKKQCFDSSGLFDTFLKSSEDREMWLRIAAAFRVFLLAEEWTLVRRHEHNMSRHADRMKTNMQKVLVSAYKKEFYPKHRILFWAKVFSHFRHETACMYFDEGRLLKALADELLSILLWPVFVKPSRVNEQPFFRLRHIAFWIGKKFNHRKR